MKGIPHILARIYTFCLLRVLYPLVFGPRNVPEMAELLNHVI